MHQYNNKVKPLHTETNHIATIDLYTSSLAAANRITTALLYATSIILKHYKHSQ